MKPLELLDVIRIESEGNMDTFNMISDLLQEEDLSILNNLDNKKELTEIYKNDKDISKIKSLIKNR